SGRARAGATERSYTLGEALRTPAWYRLTAILTLNVTAGIALLSQAAPAAVEITGIGAATAASLVGLLAVFHGAGAGLRGRASDSIGRMRAFLAIFAIQVACFLLLPSATSVALFLTLAAIIYLCYGGGFGTMPATAADFFGAKNAGAIYGAMIVGWSIGGVLGPLLIAALADSTGGFTVPFYLVGVMVLASTLLPARMTKPLERPAAVVVPGLGR